jgi:tRNA dimethylallyltransferase
VNRSAYFLVGPTGVGKSGVAQHLAEVRGVPILSADSMAIYRGMDIGTAKPSVEERGKVPYFGVDLVEPDVAFSAWDYRKHALASLATVSETCNAIVVGGTGLYIKSLTDGLSDRPGGNAALRDVWEKRLHAEGIEALQDALRDAAPDVFEGIVDKQNPRRLLRALETVGSPSQPRKWSRNDDAIVVGLSIAPELLNVRIAQRVDAMYDQGLIVEVEQLLSRNASLSKTALQAIGYAEAMALIAGRMTQGEARERTIIRTRRLAKRQRTWFRHQANAIWVEVTAESTVESLAAEVAERWREYGPTAIRSECEA